MNHVADKQDQPDNIQRLAAQRQLYKEGKRSLAIVLLIPVVFALVGIWVPSPTSGSALPAFYAFAVMAFSIIEFLLYSQCIDKPQEEAALIQELFDCSVLELPWNHMLGDKPEPRTIQRAADRHLHGKKGDAYQRLHRWYEDKTPKPSMALSLARLQCQNMNVDWDSAQRKAYAGWLSILMIVAGGTFVAIAIFADLEVRQLFVGPAYAFPTILLVAVKHYRDHRKAADNVDRLKGRLAALQAEANAAPDSIELLAKTRDLQTEIFHHRKDGPLVFEWFYKLFKKNR